MSIPLPDLIQAYFSLTVTVVGTIFNVITLIVFCRSSFRNTKARPALHYMRAMTVFDILMLYGWNFDHYFSVIHGFYIQTLTIPICRFFSFYNYFVPQTSAWIRVFVSLDRYLSLSRLHKTWFNHSKNVLIIIGCILVCCFCINCMLLICACSYIPNGSIIITALTFQLYPLWDYVNLGVYNCAPFLFMGLFNSGVIYHLIRLRQTSSIQNSQIQHRAISITLVITTFLFLFMTIPATVGFAFFYSNETIIILRVLDGILYSYHALSFVLYLITFDEFRREFIAMITGKRNTGRIGPMTLTGTANQTANTV